MEREEYIFSFGGGIQSTAVAVLSAFGKMPFKTFVFANTGDNSENPDTFDYMEKHMLPFMRRHDLNFVEVQKQNKNGDKIDLLWELLRSESRSIPIPVRMSNGSPGTRNCTAEFKIKVVAKWLKEQGYTNEGPVKLGIGISTDEAQRINTSKIKHVENYYPLIHYRCSSTLTGISRRKCERVIQLAGLPLPPKSACFYCPMKRVGQWYELLEKKPVLFLASVGLEHILNKRRAMLGKDSIFLSSRCKPLDEAFMHEVSDKEGDLDEDCTGYCMT